jgi:hypothetical protein
MNKKKKNKKKASISILAWSKIQLESQTLCKDLKMRNSIHIHVQRSISRRMTIQMSHKRILVKSLLILPPTIILPIAYIGLVKLLKDFN